MRALLKVVAEATGWFLLGILGCLIHSYYTDPVTAFASRWEGACGGWSRVLVIEDTIGKLLIWWAYSAIAVTIWRLHPRMEDVWQSRFTFLVVGTFIIMCGGGHLLAAYANFNPIYLFLVRYDDATAAISVVAVPLIGAGLIHIFRRVTARRRRLEELEAKEVKQ